MAKSLFKTYNFQLNKASNGTAILTTIKVGWKYIIPLLNFRIQVTKQKNKLLNPTISPFPGKSNRRPPKVGSKTPRTGCNEDIRNLQLPSNTSLKYKSQDWALFSLQFESNLTDIFTSVDYIFNAKEKSQNKSVPEIPFSRLIPFSKRSSKPTYMELFFKKNNRKLDKITNEDDSIFYEPQTHILEQSTTPQAIKTNINSKSLFSVQALKKKSNKSIISSYSKQAKWENSSKSNIKNIEKSYYRTVTKNSKQQSMVKVPISSKRSYSKAVNFTTDEPTGLETKVSKSMEYFLFTSDGFEAYSVKSSNLN